MKLACVCGTVVATVKDRQLDGLRLRLICPETSPGVWSDHAIVAVDAIGSRDGDTVIWVSAREASLGIPGRVVPTDAAVVAIVDSY